MKRNVDAILGGLVLIFNYVIIISAWWVFA